MFAALVRAFDKNISNLSKKVSLAYSGGSDSGFLLCCLRDLIDEGKLKKDTIEVFQGVFLLGGIPQDDAARATRFAHSLGFDHKIYNLEIDDIMHFKHPNVIIICPAYYNVMGIMSNSCANCPFFKTHSM